MARIPDREHHQRHREDPESRNAGLGDPDQQARKRRQRKAAGVEVDEQHRLPPYRASVDHNEAATANWVGSSIDEGLDLRALAGACALLRDLREA